MKFYITESTVTGSDPRSPQFISADPAHPKILAFEGYQPGPDQVSRKWQPLDEEASAVLSALRGEEVEPVTLPAFPAAEVVEVK